MGWEYVVPGYLVVFGGLGVYTLTLIRRGRALSRQVSPEKRRFLGEGRS